MGHHLYYVCNKLYPHTLQKKNILILKLIIQRSARYSFLAGDQIEYSGTYSYADICGTIEGFYVAASAKDVARDNDFVIRDEGYFTCSYSAHASTITCNENFKYDGSYSCGKATMDDHDDIRLFGYASGRISIIRHSAVVCAHGYCGAAYSDIIALLKVK